ncbi:MAG: ChaN family lipoprotein [Verrucomicrobia bacterium]|nr:ChaN family lipoprotein [Verrucomicrobiota bacterium]
MSRALRPLAFWLLAAVAGLLGACASTDARISLPSAEPLPAPAAEAPSRASADFWDAILAADVVYIGERHDQAADHEYQFEIIRGLKQRGVDFAIGWEMFESPSQPLLDEWFARRLSTDALLTQTDFQKRWGKTSPLYEKMLRWSQLASVPSVALNAPRGLSRKLAKGEKLDSAEKRLLPAGFRPLEGGLENFISQMGGHGPGVDYANYYRAQTLWDQSMADQILRAQRRQPQRKIVVFVGRGHVENGFGIPPYVRQKAPALRQIILFPGEPPQVAGGSQLAMTTPSRVGPQL